MLERWLGQRRLVQICFKTDLMVLLQIVSDDVILLVGGYERDGSPVSGAQDISETIFTYDCDRPDFPEEDGITFNTAALTADPIQKVHALELSNSEKFSVIGCFTPHVTNQKLIF